MLVVVVGGCTRLNPAYDSSGSSGGAGISSTGSAGEVSTSRPATSGTRGDPLGSTSDASAASAGVSSVAGTTGETSDTLEGGATTGEPVCERALWVTTGDPAVGDTGDSPYFERLVDLDFAVTVVENAESHAGNVGDNCLVVISPLGDANDVGGKFRDVAVPVVTWEHNIYDDMRMVNPEGTGWGVADPQEAIMITDPVHPLAAGLVGVVPIYGNNGRISWGIPEGEVEIVAMLPGEPERATIFAFEAGGVMAGGFVAPGHRVALAGGETMGVVTEQAVALFEAAVVWAVR
jgi:hypothetical protein